MKPYLALALIALVLAFPPCDREITGQEVIRGTYPPAFKPYTEYVNHGFTRLNYVGGPIKIRYPQWLIQLAAAGGVGLLLTRRRKAAD